MVKQLSYQGGVNLATSLGTMPPNQMLTASNVLLSGASLVNRGGPFKLVTPAGGGVVQTVTSLFYFVTPTGTEYFIFSAKDASSNNQVYQMVNDGTTQTATKISTGTVSGTEEYDVLNGLLVVSGNGNSQYQWTGAGNLAALGASWTALNIAGGPQEVVNNIFFIAPAYNSALSSNVYYSNIADPTTYTTGNFIPFRKSDGQFISALGSIGNDLIIFKPHSTGRLSTQTQVISGAVTLGPLTTVSEGIGCVSSKAWDHLPDGRIILVGADGHVYIFDGSIFTDISNQPYPNSNIQSAINAVFNTSSSPIPGAVVVQTYAPRNEVWVTLVNPSGLTYLVYDYFNNCWFQKPATGSSTAGLIATFHSAQSPSQGFNAVVRTLSGVYNYFSCLLSGDGSGNVWIEDAGITTDQSGSNPTTTLEFSIPVPADDKQNFQRFFVLPLKTGSAKTVNYFTGRDGTYGSSTSFTTTGGWDRLKISIPSSHVVTSYQVKITYSTSATIQFDPAYISEEVVQ